MALILRNPFSGVIAGAVAVGSFISSGLSGLMSPREILNKSNELENWTPPLTSPEGTVPGDFDWSPLWDAMSNLEYTLYFMIAAVAVLGFLMLFRR